MKEAIPKLSLKREVEIGYMKRMGPKETGNAKPQHVQRVLYDLGFKSISGKFELLYEQTS